MIVLRLCSVFVLISCFFFFFIDAATTEIYTLSLHDALPILGRAHGAGELLGRAAERKEAVGGELLRDRRNPEHAIDRKSTRLNSSHVRISYAVFCLKKKKTQNIYITYRSTR